MTYEIIKICVKKVTACINLMDQLKMHVRTTWMKEQEVYDTLLWKGDGKGRNEEYSTSARCMQT